MAPYKRIDTSPRFLALNLERQLSPGTFEHSFFDEFDDGATSAGLQFTLRNAGE